MQFRRTIIAALWVIGALAHAAQAQAPAAGKPQPAGGAGAVATATEITASVTAIDAATRAVTLRGPQGNEFVVTAGPEVRNFSALKVGDKVSLRYVEGLALALHKGSTAAPSRVEDKAAARAPEGSAPGAGAVRSVTVVAEVMALDRDKGSVTLRGPKRTLVLPVKDKSLLADVAVGDRVEATYTEAVALSVTPAK